MRLVPLALLLAGASLAVVACERPAPAASAPAEAVDPVVPYRLDAPDARLVLPLALREVSGLTVLPSGRLGAVQDESGVIYEVDPVTGDVVDELAFEDAGDYEGVALAPDAVWVLRSDGDLFRVARAAGGAVRVEKVETALGGKNDTEGLAYDAAGDRLLVAAKEDPGDGLGKVRAVYAFGLDVRTLSDQPVFTLDRALVDDVAPFKPSAIAVHPASGHVYVLSSVRKALAVLDADGTLLAVRPLDAALFPQPEGIAFAADGTLFIASEGPTGPGTILRFAPADA